MVSSIKETTAAAWNFYSQEQQLLAGLNTAVGEAGSPDPADSDNTSNPFNSQTS